MQSEQISILGLDNMFFGRIAKQFTQLGKVGRVRDGLHNGLFPVAGSAGRGRREMVEQLPGGPVKEIDNGEGQGEGDDSDDAL
jgi:hypothetical protein